MFVAASTVSVFKNVVVDVSCAGASLRFLVGFVVQHVEDTQGTTARVPVNIDVDSNSNYRCWNNL